MIFVKYCLKIVFTSVLCECEIVKPIWNDLASVIRNKLDINYTNSSFDNMFGIQSDKFITYLFLCLKYYWYVCKFQNKSPNFVNYINFIKINRDTEYHIAKRNDKLSIHSKKMEIWLSIDLFIEVYITGELRLQKYFFPLLWVNAISCTLICILFCILLVLLLVMIFWDYRMIILVIPFSNKSQKYMYWKIKNSNPRIFFGIKTLWNIWHKYN